MLTRSDQTDTNTPVHHRSWTFGHKVAAYAWEASRPKAALLLQHGFGEYAERYVNQHNGLVPNLLTSGISVYAFDLEGHGRSPGRRAMADPEQSIEYHLAARKRLESTLQCPIFLLGHSLGGLITATSALHNPHNLNGVILSSPALQVTVSPIVRMFASFTARIIPTMPARKLPPSGLSRISEQVETAVNDPEKFQGAMPLRIAESVLNISRNNWKHYSGWQLPTLVLHGTADTFTEPEGSRRFIETIRSDDKTLHFVEDGYHELLNDFERDRTLRLILDWIENRLK